MRKSTSALFTAGSSLAGLTSLSGVVIVDTNAFSVSTSGAGGISFDWDIDGDESFEAHIVTFNNTQIDFYSATNLLSILTATGYINNLSTGYMIDVNANFKPLEILSAFPNYAPGFTDGVSGYMGFRFNDGVTQYGWAEVTYTSATNEFTVSQWAFEDSGNSILAGTSTIPEPETAVGGLGALALGIAGVRRWRKNKKKEA